MITVIQNTPNYIELSTLVNDQGWTIGEGIANHGSCNAGYIYLKSINFTTGKKYRIKYEILNYVSGIIRAEFGTTIGANKTGNGVFIEDLTYAGTGGLRFYADGNLSLTFLEVEDLEDSGSNHATMAFSEKNKGFTSTFDYAPELLGNLGYDLFSWKNGQLYKHNSNELHNNFYGMQYSTKIHFVSNFQPERNKLYYSVKIDSNGRWGMPKVTTPANITYPKGMRSRIKKGNFKVDEGMLWADFMRDMNDPGFTTEDVALFKGRMLMGRTITIEMECDETMELNIMGVYIYTSEPGGNF